MDSTDPRLETAPPERPDSSTTDALFLYAFFGLLVIGMIVVVVSLGRL